MTNTWRKFVPVLVVILEMTAIVTLIFGAYVRFWRNDAFMGTLYIWVGGFIGFVGFVIICFYQFVTNKWRRP